MNTVINSLAEARKLLDDFIKDEENVLRIEKAADLMVAALNNGGKIISFGNGGSMSDAMHFAEELTGRFRDDRPAIAAISISDPSHITCTANDYGFEAVFSRFIEAMGKQEDVALAISTSGNSSNVIKGVEAARAKGMKIVSLTGKSGGALSKISDVEIRVPFEGYSDRIQEMHIKIIHIFIELIEKNIVSKISS